MDGKFYVSGVFNYYDNFCVELAMARTMEADLVIQSYQNALDNHDLEGIITHSDRGSQYMSQKFKDFAKNDAGGRCHDNAKCVSMWAWMKVEVFPIFNPKKFIFTQLQRII